MPGRHECQSIWSDVGLKTIYGKEPTERFGKEFRSLMFKLTRVLTPLALENMMNLVEEKDCNKSGELVSIMDAAKRELHEHYHKDIERFMKKYAPWAGEGSKNGKNEPV